MAYKELKSFVENLEKRINRLDFNIKDINKILLEVLKEKGIKFEEFKKKIKLKCEEFKKKNKNRIIKKKFPSFFYENFHEIFLYFMEVLFGFKKNSLNLSSKEKISEEQIIFEYNFLLNIDEEDAFLKTSNESEINALYGFSITTGYLYFLIRFLGIIIRKIIKQRFFLLLDAITIKTDDKHKHMNLMIVVKDSKDEIFNSYYQMVLFYFLRKIKGIPEEYFNQLLEGREKLYQLALEQYTSLKEKLVDLLYYFYKKCNLLQSFSPLLDFFNFVGARVEDSVFSKKDIIKKEFLINLDYTPEKREAIIRFFDYIDKKSTLYSTFQANNLPTIKSQLNLFLLYMKYYFGSGLEALEVGDLLFLPSVFKRALDNYNKNIDDVIGTNSVKNVNVFLNYLSILSNTSSIDLFFQKIFKKSISQLNYGFFKTFLKSLNSNFYQKIEQENEKLSEDPQNLPFTFNVIVDHICRTLYVLIDKIFMRSTPDDASKNFIDPRSRYIGKNIALRVLELFIFQDINYSDDVWPDFMISLNKEELNNQIKQFNIIIPEKQFYSVEELVQITTTYNIHSFSDQSFFEEWLITDILIPLNNFLQNIRIAVKDPSNEIEIYEKLSHFLISDIKDKKIIKNLKLLSQNLAPFWKIID
ncbi:MAG: hypothetical protein ACFFC3_14800 [Candidatus Odinarchaeota archaeon]